MNGMKLTLIDKRPADTNAMSFVFKPEVPIAWRAGQFMHYKLPHEHMDERKDERWFTISSAPFEKNITITTRISPNGSSFKKALVAMPLGGTIEANGPDGDFIVEDAEREMILIAGGIGITPFHSMLLELDHNHLHINAKLLYANRDDDFVFKGELEALLKRHRNFSIDYFSGDKRIDSTTVLKVAPNLTAPLFYVSGPEPMVELFEKMLRGMGILDEHMKRDYFPGYTWPLL